MLHVILDTAVTTPSQLERFLPQRVGLHADDYVAVVEEEDLPALLQMISPATGAEGSTVTYIPRSIITLPAPTTQPFAPGPKSPLSLYYPSNASTTQFWNPGGTSLIDLAIPRGVFLAPEDRASEYREQAQHNNRRVCTLAAGIPHP